MKGAGGIFQVDVDGRCVARKTLDRGFPSEKDVVDAVRDALRMSSTGAS